MFVICSAPDAAAADDAARHAGGAGEQTKFGVGGATQVDAHGKRRRRPKLPRGHHASQGTPHGLGRQLERCGCINLIASIANYLFRMLS